MSWLDTIQTSLYNCLADNKGKPATFREVLLSDFAIDHKWYYKDHTQAKWVSGKSNDLETIIDLRTSEKPKSERVKLKSTMQCYTPAALLKTKKQGEIEEVKRSGIMQLDWDYPAIKDYDIEELKQAVFALDFIAFCGLSCSGNGFFALALIAEPDRLNEYAEHLFKTFNEYGIPVDTSKGRNVNDLRFVSYDANMLIREDPEPLKIKRFHKAPEKTYPAINHTARPVNNNKLIEASLMKINNAVIGNRWETVQKVAYTLGGLNDYNILEQIREAINQAPQFSGEEDKYIKCAKDCFKEGMLKPLNK
jgi:hypothetical protein